MPEILSALLILAGCATIGTKFDPKRVEALTPGTQLAEVERELGKPNAEHFEPDGSRVETWLYSQGTVFGAHARRATLLFDASGRYVRVVSTADVSVH